MTYQAKSLQQRAAKFGHETLDDAEALALMIARHYGDDLADRANALILRHGSLAAVLAATLAELTQTISAAAALDIKMVADAARRAAEAQVRDRCIINSYTALITYVRSRLAHRSREAFHVLFLDKRNQFIADEAMGEGTVDQAPVYPREVVRRALELNASAIILVHNHPSGDPSPSKPDIAMTKLIVDAAKALNISVHDHLIVGANSVASFKALGLL